jgi:hypothetical protein
MVASKFPSTCNTVLVNSSGNLPRDLVNSYAIKIVIYVFNGKAISMSDTVTTEVSSTNQLHNRAPTDFQLTAYFFQRKHLWDCFCLWSEL